MALIITAPDEIYSRENFKNIKIFLAGGITNCPNWQLDVIEKLKHKRGITVYNPRRKDFDITDVNAIETQITWEYIHLMNSDIIFVWFSTGSLNPIVLYELGRWVNSRDIPTIIGIDPSYERKEDEINCLN